MLNLLIFVMRLLARMPLPWLRAVGHGLGWSLWHLARQRRGIVAVNLQKCMPELSEPEREALAYRHFVVFGQSVLDRAWLWHAPEALVRQRLRWVGDLQALKQPGPLVMFAPHFVGLDAGGLAVSLAVPGPIAVQSGGRGLGAPRARALGQCAAVLSARGHAADFGAPQKRRALAFVT
jgi:KDO2-lipid IV(A) lauroyltransferase